MAYSEVFGKNSIYTARRLSYNLRLKLLKDALTDKANARLLDIGSADGDYAVDLSATGMKVICLDIDGERLAAGRSKSPDMSGFVQADATCLPFADSSLDAVIILNAFRYFPHPDRAVKECERVLRPKGQLIIICHNRHCPDTRVFKFDDVVRYYTRNELRELLIRNNLEVSREGMLLVMPAQTPGFMVRPVAGVGALLGKLGLDRIYPEIFVHGVKNGK